MVYLSTHALNIELKWLSKLRENNGRKDTLVTQIVCFQMLEYDTSAEVSNSILILKGSGHYW